MRWLIALPLTGVDSLFESYDVNGKSRSLVCRQSSHAFVMRRLLARNTICEQVNNLMMIKCRLLQ